MSDPRRFDWIGWGVRFACGDVDLADVAGFQNRFGFGQGPPRIVSISPHPSAWIVDDRGLSEVRVGFSEPVSVPANAVLAWTVIGGAWNDAAPSTPSNSWAS
jgi:hypothetical protein